MFHGFLSAIGIYHLYGRWLKAQISDKKLPEHIAVVLDGNRRWARSKGQDAWDGHWAGENNVKNFLKWCRELEIKTVTLYALSAENFKRDPLELEELMKIYESAIREVLSSDEIQKNNVHVKAIGRLNLLPESLQKLISQVEGDTKNFNRFYVNIALAYSGRAEIVDATRELAEQVKRGEILPGDITEELIEEHLYTKHLPQQDPDLIIRTGSESRLSNFLLWQSAYTELFILDVYWPDFREIDLMRAIRSYQKRSRRFGK